MPDKNLSKFTNSPGLISVDITDRDFNPVNIIRRFEQQATARGKDAFAQTGAIFDRIEAGLPDSIGGLSTDQIFTELFDQSGIDKLKIKDPPRESIAGGFAAAIMAGLGDQSSLIRLQHRQAVRDRTVRENVLLRREDQRRTRAERQQTLANGLIAIRQQRNEALQHATAKHAAQVNAAQIAVRESLDMGRFVLQAFDIQQRDKRSVQQLELQAQGLVLQGRGLDIQADLAEANIARIKTEGLARSLELANGIIKFYTDIQTIERLREEVLSGKKKWEDVVAEIEVSILNSGGVGEDGVRINAADALRIKQLLNEGPLHDILIEAQMKFNRDGPPVGVFEKFYDALFSDQAKSNLGTFFNTDEEDIALRLERDRNRISDPGVISRILQTAQETYDSITGQGRQTVGVDDIFDSLGSEIGRATVNAELRNAYNRLSEGAKVSFARIQTRVEEIQATLHPVLDQMQIGLDSMSQGLSDALSDLDDRETITEGFSQLFREDIPALLKGRHQRPAGIPDTIEPGPGVLEKPAEDRFNREIGNPGHLDHISEGIRRLLFGDPDKSQIPNQGQ